MEPSLICLHGVWLCRTTQNLINSSFGGRRRSRPSLFRLHPPYQSFASLADVGRGESHEDTWSNRLQELDNRENEQRKRWRPSKMASGSWHFLSFSATYNGSYNEGILIRCERQKRSIKRDIELPVAINDVVTSAFSLLKLAYDLKDADHC